jgi:hypothetical protein
MIQWRSAIGEDIPTPNTKEIVVLTSFFQRGFGLPTYEFLHGLLHHYQIELIHLNPDLILQIVVFMHLCEAFLAVPPNLHHSVTNRKVIGGVDIQTHPRSDCLDLPMKSCLKGWHKSWFYYEIHEPSLPSFVA